MQLLKPELELDLELAAAEANAQWPALMDRPEHFNAGDTGHERIERNALNRLGVDRQRIKAIYFGNWQRDMSQILAPVLPVVFGARTEFLCGLIFQVVDLLAEAEFGRRLDRRRFGSYRWEEHIDNPRLYGRAIDPVSCQPIRNANQLTAPESFPVLWQERDDQGLLNFLQRARDYVRQQLDATLRLGPGTSAGFEHFGNAMHTLEDLFGHSNFVELALIESGYGIDPMTGLEANNRQLIRDRLGRWRLTTGVFLPNDTLVSLEKLFLQHLTQPSSDKAQRVNAVLIGRLLGDQVAGIYRRLVGLWNRTPVAWVQRQMEDLISLPLRRSVSQLLHPLAQHSARFTGNEVYDGFIAGRPARIIEISHSRLAKDDPAHRYHPLASRLAERAVQEYWRELLAAWQRGARTYEQTQFGSITTRLMNHPHTNQDWWRPLLAGALPRRP